MAVIPLAGAPISFSDASLSFFGSPGITWGFFIGWIEGGAKKTELLE
jgi:hypothetical protein